MKKTQNKLAFTLIELLVVITIIGILATGATTVFTSQIQKARDTTRTTDISALKNGIEQYYNDTFNYPNGNSDWVGSGSTSVKDYLPNLAEDPKHDQTCNGSRCGYVYTVGPDSVGIIDGAYEVSTAFENQGNIKNRADSSKDNGEDDARLELGTLKTTTAGNDLNTASAQNTAFNANVADDNDVTVVIVKGRVTKK